MPYVQRQRRNLRGRLLEMRHNRGNGRETSMSLNTRPPAPTYSRERPKRRCCAYCRTPYNCGNARCGCHKRRAATRMCVTCGGKGETCGQPCVKCQETGVVKGGK